MIESFLYIILAVLGLSFLIFIHELGHYYMARRCGMKVETFSIGFGKPLYSWMRDGVKWQIGWLLFGGYVKISGMETDEKQDIYEVQDGFFSKSPWNRIQVAVMGPLVNIVFALLAFTSLWILGGREKDFNDYTHKIGWVDPKSELYQKGVRPGDEVVSYNDQPFQGSKDHLTAPMTAGSMIAVKGFHLDPLTKEKHPFDYTVKTYPHPAAIDKDLVTSGIINSASYLLYEPMPGNQDNPLPAGSPLENSGFQYGDRIVWVDGEAIYSLHQLSNLLNDNKVLLTIQHGETTVLRRVPRFKAEELKLDPEFKEELVDWQFEAHLKGTKILNLYAIPYSLTNEAVVEAPVKLIDKEKNEEAFPSHPMSALEAPLEKGDKILAVDGIPVVHSFQILSLLQVRHANIIVEHGRVQKAVPSWRQADELFDHEYKWDDLQKLVAQVGITSDVASAGNLTLLKPVVPKKRGDFEQDPERKAAAEAELITQRKEIEKIQEPDRRAQALHQLDTLNEQLLLGFPSQDEKILYNPGPLKLFANVFEEIWHTLKALVTGTLSPKWMSGPIGIVQVVHDNSMASWKEAIFWLGAISLNLGILNLLPLPVLDGGTICFALYEMVTGKKLKAKTIEKMIIPFALLLIGFFIFLTYYDITRLFS